MVADLFKDAVFSSINYTDQKSTFTECRTSQRRNTYNIGREHTSST